MKHHRQEHFDEVFREWAERPPQTPAGEAARMVVARLPERRPGRWLSGSWLQYASAAAALALLLAVGWTILPSTPEPSLSGRELVLPPLSEDVVLLWLDKETPLYLTVAPPATKGDF